MNALLQEHKNELASGVIALILLGINLPKIQANMQHSAKLSEAAKEQQLETEMLSVKQEEYAARAEIAEGRYEDNAHLILSLGFDGKYTAITEGAPVLKGEYAEHYRAKMDDPSFDWGAVPKSHYLPSGTIIGDAYGMTAELVGNPGDVAVARYLARTGNREVIDAAKERAGIQAVAEPLIQ